MAYLHFIDAQKCISPAVSRTCSAWDESQETLKQGQAQRHSDGEGTSKPHIQYVYMLF